MQRHFFHPSNMNRKEIMLNVNCMHEVSGHFHEEATLSEAIVADEQDNYLSVACLRTWENHLVEASLQIF